MRPTLTLVVVAKSHEELAAFQLEHVRGSVDELILLANPDARFGGTGALGNHALDHGRSDVIGLAHADAILGPGALDAFALGAMAGAVTGMVGRAVTGDYVWCRDVMAAQDVSTLDSCSFFVKRSTPVRFDVRNFDNFHCCIEDFCLAAAVIGTPTRVMPAAGCDHLGTNWQKPDWMIDYWRYRALLSQKWAGFDFKTT